MDSIGKFAAYFYEDKVEVGERHCSLGEITTEFLNLDFNIFKELDELAQAFAGSARKMMEEKDRSVVPEVQRKLNQFLELLWILPPYPSMPREQSAACQLFPRLAEQEEAWQEMDDPKSETNFELTQWINEIDWLPYRLEWCYNQTSLVVDRYLEPLTKRTKDAYAFAFLCYCRGRDRAAFLLPNPSDEGTVSNTELSFVPIQDQDHLGQVVLGEVLRFNDLVSFMKTDFYRGLIHGNAPRKCQNCGKYFLLTNGYNTCYCNNIAPGETKRTCRKVGAHNKEAKKKASETPAQQEYRKAYNRLKMRKARGKISVDQWNTAVAEAEELREQAEQGKLSELELRERLGKL